ncbi:MAG: sigma factor-like helix-turn-helix DNA-binding protein [Candidatus Obscuribacterales bacterium]|nr:sigma factor-like helix-turn-helix DNA-binding protein [Candidatus Obscuribacterales bacterium]
MNDIERQRLYRVREGILANPEKWSTLASRERDLLRLRVGLADNELRELAEISQLYGLTIARIKLIEDKALKKLQ